MSLTRIKKPVIVAEEGDRRLVWLGLDVSDAEKGILANQYLLVAGGEAWLLDPGGQYVFERVYNAVSEIIDPESVTGVFYSHQDPDVAGSFSLIPEFFPNAKVYISSIWTRFIPHLGVEAEIEFVPIPDEGGKASLGGVDVEFIPAHYLHSPGHFNLYDPALKMLFTGDIGAAIFPEGEWYLFVEDFQQHARYMEWFHKRFMACRRALDKWLERVRSLEIQVLAPQHGAIFTGENVKRFLDWLANLGPVGVDLL